KRSSRSSVVSAMGSRSAASIRETADRAGKLWGGDFAVRGHLVDGLRQHLRELFGQLLDRDPSFRRQLLQKIWSQRATQIAGRDRLVGTGPHPGTDRRAETVPFELVDDARKAAVLFEDAVDRRYDAGADD